MIKADRDQIELGLDRYRLQRVVDQLLDVIARMAVDRFTLEEKFFALLREQGALQDRHDRLLDEYRRLRVETLKDSGIGSTDETDREYAGGLGSDLPCPS